MSNSNDIRKCNEISAKYEITENFFEIKVSTKFEILFLSKLVFKIRECLQLETGPRRDLDQNRLLR